MSINPDEAMGYGAAVQGAILTGEVLHSIGPAAIGRGYLPMGSETAGSMTTSSSSIAPPSPPRRFRS